MKRSFTLFLSLVTIISLFHLSSCSKGGSSSPVDEYINILDEATKKTEQIKSYDDLTNVQSIISPEEAMKIVRDNADYVLTDNDKDKLKKSYDKLLKVAYEKTAKFGGLPEEMQKNALMQADLVIEAANKQIDRANTMGDLMGLR